MTSCFRPPLAGLLMVLLACCGVARADEPDTLRERCPGAVAWRDAHPEVSDAATRERDRARSLTRPELLAELQARFDEDQSLRHAWLKDRTSVTARDAVARVDRDNYTWMLALLRKDGMPTAAQVGEHGLHLLWLLVHHADAHPEFQRVALGEFRRRFEAGEFSAVDLARFSDRVAVRFGQPQPYGTQQDWGAGGLETKRIANLDEIERNRRALGLMSLADYGCMLHEERKPRPDRGGDESTAREP